MDRALHKDVKLVPEPLDYAFVHTLSHLVRIEVPGTEWRTQRPAANDVIAEHTRTGLPLMRGLHEYCSRHLHPFLIEFPSHRPLFRAFLQYLCTGGIFSIETY